MKARQPSSQPLMKACDRNDLNDLTKKMEPLTSSQWQPRTREWLDAAPSRSASDSPTSAARDDSIAHAIDVARHGALSVRESCSTCLCSRVRIDWEHDARSTITLEVTLASILVKSLKVGPPNKHVHMDSSSSGPSYPIRFAKSCMLLTPTAWDKHAKC
jgi:hypothetical protein